jgi:hypothetical protein
VKSLRSEIAGRAFTIIAAAGLCLALGCAGQKSADSAAVNTGLAHLSEADPELSPWVEPVPPELTPAQAELYRLAEESALKLQAVFDQLNAAHGPEGAEAPEAALAVAPGEPREHIGPDLPDPLPGGLARAERDGPDAAAAQDEAPALATSIEETPVVPDAAAAPASQRPLAERIQEHATILIDLLRQQAANGPALAAMISLAGLEAIRPGALGQIITPEGEQQVTLAQSRAIAALGDFIAAAAAVGEHPDREAEYLALLAEKLLAGRPMRIGTVALCTRVRGFGQYTPLPSMRFVHGQHHPVIIYTEVGRFAHRPATSHEAGQVLGSQASDFGTLWSVELSQEVQIYHDGDGLLVWSRPEQSIVETSRNRRQDFFLINEMILPRTLSIGRYCMKVIVRDKTSGDVDEAILAFEVVADAGLARGE